MRPFTSIVAKIERDNIDTDIIMPKQFLKSITKSGFSDKIFYPWRYCNDTINSEFILNQDKYAQAKILLVGKNFGCGSSREHAVWGLTQFGFKAIIGISFADIFYTNAINNGLLCICLEEVIIRRYMAIDELTMHVDLQQEIIIVNDETNEFRIPTSDKNRIMSGLDNIQLTLQKNSQIEKFEEQHKNNFPWLFVKPC